LIRISDVVYHQLQLRRRDFRNSIRRSISSSSRTLCDNDHLQRGRSDGDSRLSEYDFCPPASHINLLGDGSGGGGIVSKPDPYRARPIQLCSGAAGLVTQSPRL